MAAEVKRISVEYVGSDEFQAGLQRVLLDMYLHDGAVVQKHTSIIPPDDLPKNASSADIRRVIEFYSPFLQMLGYAVKDKEPVLGLHIHLALTENAKQMALEIEKPQITEYNSQTGSDSKSVCDRLVQTCNDGFGNCRGKCDNHKADSESPS